MAAIVDLAIVEEGSGFEVEVERAGFDTEENTWEDLAKIWGAAPQFVKSELRKVKTKTGSEDEAEAAMWYYAVIFCGFRMI